MSYVEKIYNIANEAKKFIADTLDKENEIIFLKDPNDDSDELLLYNLPQQLYVGKYHTVYYYYITKLYKEDQNYYAQGYEQENGETYDFEIYSQLDEMIVAEIADLINCNCKNI